MKPALAFLSILAPTMVLGAINLASSKVVQPLSEKDPYSIS